MRRPSIVWISLESFRADHTSLAGYDRDTTPNLARFADEPGWQSHPYCYSAGIWTRSSTASIMTGTYPSHHRTGFDAGQLPPELDTVPELLGDIGYETACVSPNPHIHPSTDINRGFDTFTYLDKGGILKQYGPMPLVKYALNIRKHSIGFSSDMRRHCFGYLINDLAKRNLTSTDSPQFLYVHHPDSHHPYVPPIPYKERFLDECTLDTDEAIELAFDASFRMEEYVANGTPFNEREQEALTALYDTQLVYVDSLVKELVEYVLEHVDNTIVVLSGDHGELFGEHDLLGHRITTDTAVSHVPLVVYGLEEANIESQPVVQHVDVMQTILESVGADTSQFQGIDLRTEQREYAITQRGSPRTTQLLDKFAGLNPDFDRSKFVEADVTSVQTAEHRYEYDHDGGQLFRIRTNDTDCPTEDDERAAELREFATEWLDGPGTPVTDAKTEAKVDDATRKRLKELGYMAE